jgi:hypothetical protein
VQAQGSERSPRVRLTILSSSLNLGDLEKLIGVAPDESWEAGSKYVVDGRVVERERPFNGVRFCSRLPNSAEISRHIMDITDRLGASGFRVGEAANSGSIERCLVSVGVFDYGSDNIAVRLDQKSLSALASLGAELLVDVYT